MKLNLLWTALLRLRLSGPCLLALCGATASVGYAQIYESHTQGISGVILDGDLNPIVSPGTLSIRKAQTPGKSMPNVDDVVTFGPTQAYLPAPN